ncbi:MAG TPA: UvrD-helicase domain-containing protein, partial [Paracoccaceae bacterium]|nr:UvrD-helicase domain-containing protein [Paracoccaceae bacterium]
AEELGLTLADLAGDEAPVTDPERLSDARRLFARALETPGGLKIQTIHAFCTEVLRRFPLEAGVSPRFDVADDRRSRALMAEVREAMAEAAADAFDGAARTLTEDGIDALAEAVLRCRESFGGDLEACIEAHFGPDGALSEIEICRDALADLDWSTYAALRMVLLANGRTYDRPVGEALAVDPEERGADPESAVDRLIRCVLTQKMEPRSPRGFPAAEVKRARPQAEDELRHLTNWAMRTRGRICAARIAARVRDLHAFADDLLARHERAKAAGALMDFDDLVRRTRALMTDGEMRGWVLWKLDQGIDHILVDEGQDTAPSQWDVIAAIAEEFFAGEGARPQGRSIFVVGDEKQSIYSFQGAEPHAFGRMRGHFASRLEAIGAPLGRPDLVTSYRSAPAILAFADAVFAGDAGQGLTVSGVPVRHAAHRAGAHGRVDLWPVIDPDPKAEERPWHEPVDAVPASDTKARLAVAIADRIADMIGRDWLGPRPPDRAARPIRAGDILVLVARRDRLASGLIRELKKRGVAVAGADRMVLTAEIAVQDLLALAKVACQPGDELSLAALLKSPLCGLDEDALFDLAWGREGGLWRAVQRSGRHGEVAAFLSDMAAQADFLRPYEFLERALIRHDGRRRLVARLGPEAEDAIDELLAQALAYEAGEPPSLTGFTAWIEAEEIQVKREMDSAGDSVRVMTVHGAKGLEAPVVILPDTISGGRPNRGPLLLPAAGGDNAPELTLWLGAKGDDDPVCAAARAEAEAREKAERKRLLYVALTRAEDWLILCGAGLRSNPKDTWYHML